MGLSGKVVGTGQETPMKRLALLAVMAGSISSAFASELPADLPKIPQLPDQVTAPQTNIPKLTSRSANPPPVTALPNAITPPVTVTTPAPATMPSTAVSPWPTNCSPTVGVAVMMSPLPVAPTVPVPTGIISESRPGFFKHMMGWFNGCKTCETTTATCPTPQVRVASLAKSCPTPAANCPTESCAKPTIAKRVHSGPSLDRLKTWFAWKPCQEQLIPIWQPSPYESPVSAYTQDCKEPTAGIPCVKDGKKCATNSCPQPAANSCANATPAATTVGPVASHFSFLGLGGKAKPVAATPPTVVPASAMIPTALPTTAAPAQNPLVRPFTSP
jgi:hypothetical protein